MENKSGITVLSLFDGMSCGQQALERAGIGVSEYYASEIDKHAIAVTMHNYPNTKQLGSVVNVDGYSLPKIDLLIGGSPCQSFSFAGKRKGMSTKDSQEILTLDHYLQLKVEGYEFEGQSYLFWEFMRLLNECKPTYFLLENVEMGEKWESVLRKAIGVKALHINSALVSAQNRKRIYFTNIGMREVGLFGDLESIIQQPKDKGILLRDVLERDVPEKYYLSDKMLKYFSSRAANFNAGKVNIRDEDGKSTTLTASMASCDISDNFIKVDTNLQASKNQDKANCFTAGGNSGGLHSDMTLICVDTNGRVNDKKTGTIPATYASGPDNYSSRPFIMESKNGGQENKSPDENDGTFGCIKFGRTEEAKELRRESMKKGIDYTPFQAKEITGIDYEKMNTLSTAINKDNLLMLNERQKANHKNEDEKANTFLSTSWKGSQANGMTLVGSFKIRRLTPIECERLQTVADNYTSIVSDTQRYRMLGNGWTIDVIAHIFSYLPKEFFNQPNN